MSRMLQIERGKVRGTSGSGEGKCPYPVVNNNNKLENVAIANALQLEVARRHASPHPL